ncbi:hypothetical protein HYG81_18580 [Natrinema zhouii]|uniref:hypothetical protein n=1 Tax=Natrinema zhouii TaxID=1710539 RepID=UPI001CFFA14C|nr:hypothetical protein [Natrinema zhouii]UHQ97939.1 hypothetical protein HYG81_18580 [Natrinema zhouii]
MITVTGDGTTGSSHPPIDSRPGGSTRRTRRIGPRARIESDENPPGRTDPTPSPRW